MRKHMRERREAEPELYRLIRKKYQESEKGKTTRKIWAESNKDKLWTLRKRFKVLMRDGFKCGYCGKEANDTILEVDHIIPKSKGGSNSMENLITSCYECNRGKSDLST